MKKIFAIMAVVMLLAPAVAFAAAADGVWTADEIKDGNQMISTLSNKVTLATVSAGDAYAAVTGHSAGNKIYGSTSGDTKIYVAESDPVDVSTNAPSDSDTAQFATDTAGLSWKAL